MLFDRLSANWKLAATSNRFLLVTTLVNAIAILILATMALQNRERVVITPPTINKTYTVGWNSASIDYYKDHATFFAGIFGQVGPKNLKWVLDVVDMYAAPDIAQGIKTKLRLKASTYEFRNSSSAAWFEGSRTAWEDSSRKVFAIGYLHSMTASKQEIIQPVVYEFIFDIVEGRPVMRHFDSYESDVPHDAVYFSDKKRVEADLKRREEAERQTLTDLGMGPTPPTPAPAPGQPQQSAAPTNGASQQPAPAQEVLR